MTSHQPKNALQTSSPQKIWKRFKLQLNMLVRFSTQHRTCKLCSSTTWRSIPTRTTAVWRCDHVYAATYTCCLSYFPKRMVRKIAMEFSSKSKNWAPRLLPDDHRDDWSAGLSSRIFLFRSAMAAAMSHVCACTLDDSWPSTMTIWLPNIVTGRRFPSFQPPYWHKRHKTKSVYFVFSFSIDSVKHLCQA